MNMDTSKLMATEMCKFSSSGISQSPSVKNLDLLDTTILKKDSTSMNHQNDGLNFNKKSEWSSVQRIIESGLCPGDRLEIDRGLYSHWGIYCGYCNLDNDVHFIVHLGVPLERPKAGALSQFKKGEIRIDNLKEVAGSSLARINNECDSTHKPYEQKKIVQRAINEIGTNKYNLILQNCECFTNWCRYGFDFSQQTYPVGIAGISAVAASAGGLVASGIGAGIGAGFGAAAGIGVGAVVGGVVGAVVGGVVIPIYHKVKARSAKKHEQREFGEKNKPT